jgi:hypothetical protein
MPPADLAAWIADRRGCLERGELAGLQSAWQEEPAARDARNDEPGRVP